MEIFLIENFHLYNMEKYRIYNIHNEERKSRERKNFSSINLNNRMVKKRKMKS